MKKLDELDVSLILLLMCFIVFLAYRIMWENISRLETIIHLLGMVVSNTMITLTLSKRR